jgi:phosphoribosylanthranilate isomerase
VFVENVRRQISLESAVEVISEYRGITDNDGPDLVGLFANQTTDIVNRAAEVCGLDMVQLCGSENPTYCKDIEIPIVRQVKIAIEGPKDTIVDQLKRDVEEVTRYGAIPLLDRMVEGSLGGTGKTFDWSITSHLDEDCKFILAGGLTPINVEEAIKISSPWIVDVSSGVESDGLKDKEKITAFAKAVVGY